MCNCLFNAQDEKVNIKTTYVSSVPSTTPSSSPSEGPSVTALPVTDLPTPAHTPNPTVTTCLPNTRKVKIEASPGQYLQLFSVQVFSSTSGSCLAVGKTATQSSTRSDKASAYNAIDSTKYSFSRTEKGDPNAWWELDLGYSVPVKTVYIGQHMCRQAPDPTECFCHLSNANVMLLDDHGITITNYTLGNICSNRHTIEFDESPEYCYTSEAPSSSPSSISEAPSSSPSSSSVSCSNMQDLDVKQLICVPFLTNCVIELSLLIHMNI